jgi:hypothetical protein
LSHAAEKISPRIAFDTGGASVKINIEPLLNSSRILQLTTPIQNLSLKLSHLPFAGIIDFILQPTKKKKLMNPERVGGCKGGREYWGSALWKKPRFFRGRAPLSWVFSARLKPCPPKEHEIASRAGNVVGILRFVQDDRLEGAGDAWKVRVRGHDADRVRTGSSCPCCLDRLGIDMDAMRAAFDEVYVYTMGRAGFILQHVVDAYAVQTATRESKPMSVVFGLVGLYLHIEKGFTGRQVQEAHMKMARKKREWPSVALPEERGNMTVEDVLAAPAGPERNAAIEDWCRVVWGAFGENRERIAGLLKEYRIG